MACRQVLYFNRSITFFVDMDTWTVRIYLIARLYISMIAYPRDSLILRTASALEVYFCHSGILASDQLG